MKTYRQLSDDIGNGRSACPREKELPTDFYVQLRACFAELVPRIRLARMALESVLEDFNEEA